MRKILLSLISVLFINSSAYCQNNLTVPTINATDVILSWDDGGCSQGNYILRYREDGAAWNQNPAITITNIGGSQTYSLSGINISTTYNWRMKCGNGGSWVNGPDFTTLSTPPCDGPYVIPPPANIAGLNYLGTYNGSYYYESISTGYDWNSANSICISHGGNLAIITDMSENDSLHNWTTNSYNWMGLYQNLSSSNYSEPSGGWEWIDGNTLSYINGGWIGYENWDPSNNEPNNSANGNHGVLQSNGTWDDTPGSYSFSFIMEVPRITQTITDFSPDPLTGYLQWSYDTLIITNTSSCDINIRPEFIISHPTSAITATDLLIQWESPLGWNVGTIPYQIDGNGDAYGFWGFPSNDSTGYILTAGLSQLMKIRVHFKNPSQSPPNGAPFGTYTADWTTYQVDSLGNILQTLAPSSSVSLTLSDCSNYSVIDSISTNNVSCNGLSDGDAEVALNSTGSGNYSFLWSNGQTAGSIGNLTAGTYTVIVTDIGLGCVDSMTTIITEPNLPSVSLIGTHITCNGADDGILNASVGGGSGQFDFIWTPSLPNQANQANLPPDAYSLNVVDLLCGDIASASYTITEPDLLSSSIINPTDNTSCNPIICNGSFGLTLSGGTQPYVYSWANSSNTDSLRTDLCAGTYTITASDANSCNTFIENGTIADNPFSPYACVTGNDISCAGLTDGSAQASISTGGCGTISSLSYCASSPGTNDYANIELVRIIGDGDSIVNNTSGICDTYEDYTNQYTTLTPGQTYSINVNLGSCNPVGGTIDSAGIFIDWNLNGDFTDSGEKIAVFSGVPSPSINTISITVPNTAALGPTRMRIVSQAQINNQFYPDGPVSACAVGNFGTTYNQPWYGATEDYSIVISGSIPATYIWSNGDTTSSISGLSVGTYSCILTDLNGCSSTNSVIISEPSPILVVETTTDVSCSGYSDGTATLSISGGTPPYSENWNGNDSSALAVGVYYYTITDSAGCIYTDSVSISGPSPITITETITNVNCYGGNDGTATLSISGGTSPYFENWNGNDSSALAPGIYYYTITDGASCVYSDSVLISEPSAALSVTDSTTNVSCYGGNDGTVTIYITGGTQQYTLFFLGQSQIVGPSGIYQLPSTVPSGVYPYYILDANSCLLHDTITITEPSQLTIIEITTNVDCYGGNDGTATLSISGGTSPYFENWNGNDSSALATGVYYYTVTDDASCIYADSVSITQPDSITIVSQTTTNVDCYGGNDGTATLSISGGTPPYSENWFGENPNSLSAGTYIYQVSDNHGCFNTGSSGSITITQPVMPLTVSEITTNVSCNGGNDGIATLSISGGTPPYSENWNGNDSSALAAGVYSYTITDDAGCIYTGSVSITQPSVLTFDAINTNDVTDCINGDGYIDITISGGTIPYSYLWNNGGTTEDITNLFAGNYSIIVTDSLGCTIDSSNIIITNPFQLTWTIDSTNYNGHAIDCYGDSTGGIYITTTGGVGTITYSWVNVLDTSIIISTNDTASNLAAGTYIVTTTDGDCIDFREITIHDPSIISVHDDWVQLNCTGSTPLFSDSLIISGGTSPYTTVWLNGANPDSLSAGVHYYTITDDNGCSIDDSVTLNASNPLSIVSGNETDVACHGDNTGAAVFLITGGILPYTYLWSNGDTNAVATNLIAGVYSCTIQDDNNCSVTGWVSVSQPSSPLLSSISMINSIACFGDSTGSALITASGGMPPYEYEWDNGETDSLAINLSVGGNFCTITDYNNCELIDGINMTQSPNIIYSDSISDYNSYQIRCYGDNNGLISLTVSGGVPNTQGNPYSYQWTGPNGFTDSSDFIDSLVAGEYSFILSDSLGCEKRDTFLLEEPNLLYTSLDSTYDIECWDHANNPSSGFAKISIYGGVTDYMVNNWTIPFAGSIYNFYDVYPDGTHIYIVTDINNCTYTDSFTLIHLTADSLYTTSTLSDYNGVNISCKGYSDGWITIDTILGGLSPYSFNWSNGDSTLLIDTLSAGWYTSIVTDSFGCIFIDNIQITEPNFALDTYLDTFNVSCNGYCDGMLIANSIDGTVNVTGPYTFQWYDNMNNLMSTNDTLDSLCAGLYSLIVTDNNGCIDQLSPPIVEPLILSVNLDSIFNVSENGFADGAIYINTSGGNGGYISSWTGPNGYTSIDEDIENLSPGTYQIVISDILGCYSDTSTYIITEPPSVTINVDSINSSFITTCYDSCNGSIIINPILSPPVAFNTYWMGPNGYTSTDEDIDSLCAGNYILYIISGVDSVEFNFTINEPDMLAIDIQNNDILCYAGNAFTTAYAYGGTLPYNWIWSNNTQNISALLDSGTHYVTVTDYHGCTISDSITLSQPDSMWFTADTIPPSCSNRTDGAISIDNIHNGTSPFLYSIDNFTTYQTSDIFINLSPGGYLISIEDSNGCIAIDSFFISNPTPFSVTTQNPIYSADTVECNGYCNGLVGFLYSGENGIPDASWEQWSGPNLNGDLCPGMYNCIFTDDNGCTATLNNITIHNEDPIVITSTSSNAPTCKDGDDGSALVEATGPDPSGVSYIWYGIPDPSQVGSGVYEGNDPHGGGVNVPVLEAGTYWCHIKNGTCVDSIAVAVPPNNTSFYVEITYNGSVLATGNTTGGGAIQSYNWSTGETTPTISPTTNGQYWLIVTDNNGCISDTAFYNIIGIPSGIDELSNNLFMYPNPTTGILFIDSENNFSKIDILNHIGEKVFSKEMKTPHTKLELDLSRFSKGIYHIQITINNQLLNNKIILQ